MGGNPETAGIADDGIKRRAPTKFPAYLGVLGVKKIKR